MTDSSDFHSDEARPEPPEWDAPDESPPTEPRGELVPPPRKPPTAISGPVEGPFPPRPRRFVEAWRQPGWRGQSRLTRLTNEFFDALDGVADRVAEQLGLR